MGAADDEPRVRLDQDEPPHSPFVHPPYREPVRVSREELGYLGRDLRAMYQSLLSEPVPDHLLDLIQRLEQQGASR